MDGQCYCGFVRYRISGPTFSETCCHCSICRRTSGAPFVAWLSVARSAYELLAGEPAEFRSSEHARRTFCPRCGTALTFQSSEFPGEIDVTACSLAQPELAPPKDHTFCDSKLRWIELCDGLPAYGGSRP